MKLFQNRNNRTVDTKNAMNDGTANADSNKQARKRNTEPIIANISKNHPALLKSRFKSSLIPSNPKG